MDKFLENEAVSSIVNDGIRVILNLFIYLFFFFTRRFHTHKKHKKHKMQTSDFPPLRHFLCA